jgi:hypothetical protein
MTDIDNIADVFKVWVKPLHDNFQCKCGLYYQK